MSSLFISPFVRPLGTDGRILPLGKLFFYQTGTLTEAPVYDEDGDTLDQPVLADITGAFPNVFMDDAVAYRVRLENAAGVEQGDVDPWTNLTASGISTTEGGTVQDVFNNVPAAIGALGDGTDETATVQAYINARADTPTVEARGTVLEIPEGVKFHLRELVFPRKVNLGYTIRDDIDTYFLIADAGSGERVYFSANSSYLNSPGDPEHNINGGAVNEWRFTAPFHPGLKIDVRKDVPGHDAHFAPSQNRTNPANASFGHNDEQSLTTEWQYQFFAVSRSKFSGHYFRAYRRIQTLNGIDSAKWPSAPALNDRIVGTLAGIPDAVGYFLSSDGSATTVEWVSGRFKAGMTITNATATVTATATQTADSNDTPQRMQPIAQDFRGGGWGIGVPPGSALDTLDVGGDIGVTKSIDFGQYIPETIAFPGIAWRLDLEAAPTTGASVRQASGENQKRLWVYDLPKYNASNVRGMVGAVCASVAFAHTMILANSAINIAASGGLTNPATGRYRIVLKRAQMNQSLCVQSSMHRLMSAASGTTFYTIGHEVIDASTIDIYVRLIDLAAGTSTAADIPASASISVTVLNGDVA